MAIQGNLSNMSRLTLAAVVGALAYTCTADAVQTANTPNAAFISYNLAAGAATVNYNPVANLSTLVMGTCTTVGERGVGFATILKIPATDPSGGFIQWSGQNSPSNTANSGTNSANYSPPAGTRIINLDYGDKVYLERGTTNDSIRIRNTATAPRAGNMTWVW